MIDELRRAAGRDVPRETFEKLEVYAALVAEENDRQNLVSASTIEHFWQRHIVDSAQLLRFAPSPNSSWADIGSGAGLPGIVIACLGDDPVSLIEPRRLRAEFLLRVIDELHLNATVQPFKAQRASGKYGVITGRAVAHLHEFLAMTIHLSTTKSVWVLPKGRNAAAELAEARISWHGLFHVEQSLTDEDSQIIVASGVRKR